MGPLVVMLGALAMACAGCVSLTAVQTFSKVSAETANYRAIVDDYADSARRYLLYRGPNPPAELQQNLEQAHVNRANLLALQTALCEYLEALGTLATDEAAPMAAAGDKLTAAMVSTRLVASDEVDAARAIARIALRVAAGAQQQRALRDVIGEANAPLQRVTAALEKFVGVEYVAQLDRESGAMRQMLSENIADNPRLESTMEPVKGLARLMYDDRQRDLELKRARVQPYVAVLHTIAAGHQALYESRDHLETKNLSDRIRTYTTDLKTLGKVVRP